MSAQVRDGVGYALAEALGHTLEPPVPALTPLAAEDPWCRALQGLTVEAELRLIADGKEGAAGGSALRTNRRSRVRRLRTRSSA